MLSATRATGWGIAPRQDLKGGRGRLGGFSKFITYRINKCLFILEKKNHKCTVIHKLQNEMIYVDYKVVMMMMEMVVRVVLLVAMVVVVLRRLRWWSPW